MQQPEDNKQTIIKQRWKRDIWLREVNRHSWDNGEEQSKQEENEDKINEYVNWFSDIIWTINLKNIKKCTQKRKGRKW